MSKLVQLLQSSRRSPRTETHPNYEGAPAYSRGLQERVVQVLTTGTLSDTFYASRQELAVQAVDVLTEANRECPEFLARALIYARERGFMKTLPVLGLAILSGGPTAVHKSLFRSVFGRVVRIPDDLREFVALSVAGVVPGRKGLGGVTVEAVRQYLGSLSEYHAVKYGSAASRGIPLGNIIRMTHPRPVTPVMAERYGWLLQQGKGLGSDPDLNPQLRALEALKQTDDEAEQLALIRQGRLPYEAVVPALKRTSPAVWSELLRQAPYFNLVRGLATFTRHGVFQDEANVRYAVERLTDPPAVARSMVLPFRYFDAWHAYTKVEGCDMRIADALRAALDLTFANVPSLGTRRVALGIDVSGSMGEFIPSWVSNSGAEHDSPHRFVDIAGIFCGALLKRSEGPTITLPFEGHVHLRHDFSARDDVFATAQKIASIGGGSTAVGAPIQHLLDEQIRVDAFIGITDQEDWAHGIRWDTRASFLDLWNEYRAKIAPDAKAYLITIAPYPDAVAPSGTPGVRFIYGWSDAALKYIALDLESGRGQVQDIAQMSLQTAGDPKGSIGDE